MKQHQLERIAPFLVSVIIPMKNSATTILHTLKSVVRQSYPIKEIIIVDNVSTDNSVELALEFAKKSIIPVHIIRRKENKGVGASYNFGVKKAISSHVIFMHSDSSLPSDHEIEKLVEPFGKDLKVVASYPKVILPKNVWDTYNFWQKCLFSRSVDKESAGFNGKFDCVKKKAFVRVGGFNEISFGGDVSVGGEDADLYLRLENKGKLILSKAKVIHLHYLGNNYSLSDWIKNRKLLARTYGRLIRFQGKSLPLKTYGKGLLIPLGVLNFLIKPGLAILPFIPNLHLFGIVLLIIYAFVNSKKIYTTLSTLLNPRIIFLPFIDIFLVYYETFWMIQAFSFVKRKV
ncbi:MAG: glycosyltransferase family 2 protein [Patescibacteria group bacterium]